MNSLLFLLLLIIISLTNHACEARYLSFSSIKELNITSHHTIKGVAMKLKHDKVLKALNMKQDRGKQGMVSESSSDTSRPFSDHDSSQQEVQSKVGSSNKDGLLTRQNEEEKEKLNIHNGVEADLGFMDYQQPQRGPSTHNK